MSTENNNQEQEELEFDILTLLDEDGNEHQFELADAVDFEDKEYVALIPIYENPDELLEDSGDLVIMRVAEENGEEFLDAVEDDDEYDRVSELFTQRLSEIFEFDEDEE